jgi:hypothetical protein
MVSSASTMSSGFHATWVMREPRPSTMPRQRSASSACSLRRAGAASLGRWSFKLRARTTRRR